MISAKDALVKSKQAKAFESVISKIEEEIGAAIAKSYTNCTVEIPYTLENKAIYHAIIGILRDHGYAVNVCDDSNMLQITNKRDFDGKITQWLVFRVDWSDAE